MPATIPCPNPNCEQKFAAETIQGTGKLACPRCGTVFQFRPATPAPPVATTPPVPVPQPQRPVPAQVPMAQPVRPTVPPAVPPVPQPSARVPVATPLQAPRVPPPVPGVPMATPVPNAAPPVTGSQTVSPPVLPGASGGSDEEDEEDGDEDDENFVRVRKHDPRLAFNPADEDEDTTEARRRRRARSAWMRWLWLGPLLLTAFSTTIVVSILLYRFMKDPELSSDEAYAKLENAYFPLPDRPWARTQDDVDRAKQIRGKMKVNYVVCRSNPSNTVAIFSRDYENRMPTENELLDTALQRLRQNFVNLEWEKKEESGTLAEKKAMRIEFHGVDSDKVPTNGEVWGMAHRGVGYWFFTWGPEDQRDVIAPEWDSQRTRFALGTKREGWKPTPPKSETIAIPNTRYQIRYPDESWERRIEDGWDSAALVVLAAYEREGKRKPLTDPRQRYAAKMAVCQVLSLPKADSLELAVEATKKYLLDQQKKENDNIVLQTAKDRKEKDHEGPAEIGGLRGYITRQELVSDAVGKRFFLLAIVSGTDGVLVLEFECPSDRKEYWEGEFEPVWQSLRLTKPAD